MKNFSLYIVLLGALILSSCGTTSSLTQSGIMEDGIYYNPDYSALKASAAAEEAQIAQLTQETKTPKVYAEPADTIVLGATAKDVTVPLEIDKTYVVLLEGETYEERFRKFDDEDDYTFSINFEYGYGSPFYGYPYSYAYPYRATWNLSWYHPWYGPTYPWGWYDPWYDPWYSPWYGPSYAWGWYDPWYYPYYPGFYPGYYPGWYPGYYPVASTSRYDVIQGRREKSRPVAQRHLQANTPSRTPSNGREVTPSGINQIRGREITSSSTVTNPGTSGSAPKRSGIRDVQQNSSSKYRQSSAPSRSQSTSTERKETGRATYQYNNGSQNQNRSTSSNNYNYQSRSGYQGGSTGGAYRSSGSSSSGGRTGGRR